MPEVLKGRDRLDWKGDPNLLDMVKRAAHRADMSVSKWIKKAIESALREDGYVPPPRAPLDGFEPEKKRRPRKTAAAS